jgi:hypothetical protein
MGSMITGEYSRPTVRYGDLRDKTSQLKVVVVVIQTNLDKYS